MRRLFVIVGTALLLAGASFGALAASVRLTWEEVPPSPESIELTLFRDIAEH